MVQKLSEIKAESGRDLDSLVDENLLIPAETGAGTFGVLRFFQGIKNFFKGITALKTLSSTGRIPITDANGNVNYVTPQQILDAVSTINGDKNFANNVSVAGALNVKGENLYDKINGCQKISSIEIWNTDLNTVFDNGVYFFGWGAAKTCDNIPQLASLNTECVLTVTPLGHGGLYGEFVKQEFLQRGGISPIRSRIVERNSPSQTGWS